MIVKVIRRLGAWLLIACVFIILIPKSASAHAYVVKSNPAENETLKKAPSVVKIEFDEDIQVSSFNTLFVRDTSGKRVDLKDAHIDKKNKKILEAGLKENLKNGLYSIQWKAISADGHPIQGVIPFRIGLAEAGTDDIKVEEMGYVPQIDMIMERGILYTNFSLFIGVLLFNLILYKGSASQVQSRSKKIIWISLFGIFISLLFNLPLQAKINADVSWLEAFDPLLLKETLQLSVFGYVWITQMALISTLMIVTYFAVKSERLSSFKVWSIPIVLFIGLLVMKAFNSHAYGLKFKEIAVVMDFLHLFAASLWMGGLSSIVLLLRKEDDKWTMYWDAIKRFSPWATGAVIVILLTGLFNSTFFIPTIHSLFDTKYGLALLAKILLFVCMGILGIIHYVKGRMRAQQRLGATVKVEFIIGIIVFVIVAFMTNVQTPPMPPTGPFTESKQLDSGYELTLHVSPNKVGQNTFHITLKDENGQPVTDMEQIVLTTQSLDMNMGKGSFKVSAVSPGEYEAEGMYINMTGNWNIQVHGLTKSLDSFDTDYKFIVGGR
ncbi:copper resistance protein CopC [Bacillus sp. TH22]|uniref:copper resistance CopC/CopD family protein n=1 Tax=unclassified Bacillus (in: firmicutes) TaxID=185979 RepID=UPI0019125224|nr:MULTISPECIES: copper resistance CopC/CopD family protein [unclassified Bacillus (in: firmicutes)]MBK5358233.1 copper resistance protein CopC [Bacillus sp. TH44]MBK5346434.1 copper resistance protein CopC [Bacillus sp. TH45]MBK5366676.1 copper resistance protein CopC [Bacillus sp. TH50]MBK5448230.1 copper resistance protein CopC [Bacillus sp. TH22]MBK5452927.1 copper resistance protein CopC [Bacillus sp. TH23]